MSHFQRIEVAAEVARATQAGIRGPIRPFIWPVDRPIYTPIRRLMRMATADEGDLRRGSARLYRTRDIWRLGEKHRGERVLNVPAVAVAPEPVVTGQCTWAATTNPAAPVVLRDGLRILSFSKSRPARPAGFVVNHLEKR